MVRAAARRYSCGMHTLANKARAYLDARRGERVTLQELSRAVGASPFHLQRRFKERFGLSPSDYQREAQLEDAKRHLANGSRVTDALFEAGYGSVSRFYEKAAARLGMAARDYRAKGKGVAIRYTIFRSDLGVVLVAATEAGLCSVKLGDDTDQLRRLLAEEFSEAELNEDAAALEEARRRILAFIAGSASLGTIPVDIRGTVFQRRVWSELARIPRGETRSYQQIAQAIGKPRALRAVGSACGANPVALVIPCHRALRADGGLGGYAWGIERKRKLLAAEKLRKE